MSFASLKQGPDDGHRLLEGNSRESNKDSLNMNQTSVDSFI